MLNPNSPGSRPGLPVNFQLPFPHGNPTVNNLQRLAASGGKDITSSSPLLVNLLQSDVAAGHFNNLPHQHRMPFPFENPVPPVKRKRRPRKYKDGPKVPKLGDEDTSIPLPGTFPGISSQPPLENRVPPMGTEAAFYNVPTSLATNSNAERLADATSSSGAQVHTPPLVERYHGNQGGPSSNQVSPTSSATLSVSTPSPVRTTPEKSLGSSGMQQMINPYTGQLETVENSPSDRPATKPESSGDSAALDVPAQLQPPPNPMVALETRLVGRSENPSIPSQLPSSPKTIDSTAAGNRNVPTSAQGMNTAGTMISGPNQVTVPPISTVHDSMQSKTSSPSTVPRASPDVSSNGTSAVTSHMAAETGPVSTSHSVSSVPVSSTEASRTSQHQGPTSYPREHPFNPMQRLAESVSGMMPSEMRPLSSGMGHPELRLRMPAQRHPVLHPHLTTAERHSLPPSYPSMPRSQASGMSSLSMHGVDPGAMGRGVPPGHPRMPHPQHRMHHGYFGHHTLLPTTSGAQVMMSNTSQRFPHASPGTPKSVIASQLMRPALAAGSSMAMSGPGGMTASSAQMTHPAIASQLSQNSSSPTKVPLATMEPKGAAGGSLQAAGVMVSSANENVPKADLGNSSVVAKEPEVPDSGPVVEKAPEQKSVSPEQTVSKALEEAAIESEQTPVSSAGVTVNDTKAAAINAISTSSGTRTLSPTVSQSEKSVISVVRQEDSVQVSSQLVSSTIVARTECVDDKTPHLLGATGTENSDTESAIDKRTEPPDQVTGMQLNPAAEKKPDKEAAKAGDEEICKEEVRNGNSPLLELPASVPSGSQDSDSPPTTASPGDSDSAPLLDNCHERKISDVTKLQPSPPHGRTTMSAMAIHNDLHSLVRGSNGASTGEASPASDNFSSTSQQNYGQSPLGNSVGSHLNHDSELSSQSFDDNSSTPPHTQAVVGPSIGTAAVIRENHSDSATKSKGNFNAASSEQLPKETPATTVPETKNVITVGYAVSSGPLLDKEMTEGGLTSISKSLEDIPYLKKPSVDGANTQLKGVSLATDFLEKPVQDTEKQKVPENISKESLNYRGQVPLFSKTMETCDLNPGGSSFQKEEGKIPVNGDVRGEEVEMTADKVITSDPATAESSEQNGFIEKRASSSNANCEDADVPGESVEKRAQSNEEQSRSAEDEKRCVVGTLPDNLVGASQVDSSEKPREKEMDTSENETKTLPESGVGLPNDAPPGKFSKTFRRRERVVTR